MEKAKKNVANMEVLKDIRGLLSTAQEKEISQETEIAQYKAEIKRYEELVQRQQEELERLRGENTELAAKLNLLHSIKAQETPLQSRKSDKLNQEIARLEEKKSEIERMLQLKLGELLRRIAKTYQMSGEGDLAIEFQKTADSLETAEDFAHFLQVLLREV
jgi:predicted RNase H-like nuclease (RuvC/YqgF family)